MTQTSLATRLGRLALKLACVLAGGAAVAGAPVAAQTVAPDQAPADWIRYAELATRSVSEWLQAESGPAARLRTYLDATRPSQEQSTKPFVLGLWIHSDGTVTRIAFQPFAHEKPNADLRALIIGRRLSEAPPKDMLLPLRVLVQLPPVPPAPGDTSPASEAAKRFVRVGLAQPRGEAL